MSTVLTWISGTLIILGSLMALTAAIGIVRFPDTLLRMHAATKPQVIGLNLVLAGTCLRLYDDPNVWMLILVGSFTVLTAPVVAHLIGRTSYRERGYRKDLLIINEMDDDVDDQPS